MTESRYNRTLEGSADLPWDRCAVQGYVAPLRRGGRKPPAQGIRMLRGPLVSGDGSGSTCYDVWP